LEEKKNILKNKIRAALWYPSFMLLFATAVVIFLMINVIPTIAVMFEEQEKNLPLPTEIVIGLSNLLSSLLFWIITLALLSFIYIIYRRYVHTKKGRIKVDKIKLRIPIFKNLYKKVIVYRFTQNLGILLNNRVDLINSFEIVSKIIGNLFVEEKILKAADDIKEGISVTKAIKKSDFLPKLVLGMISAGEASDNLDNMLLNIGSVYENEIDLTVTNLTGMIEPIIIIIMGFVIGMIVFSVMLPIMEMSLLIK